MSIDKTRVLRRKKRARFVLILALLGVVAAAGSVWFVLRGKDRLLSSKLNSILAVVETKTGLSVTFEQFTTNMTSRAEFTNLQVTMPNGAGPTQLAGVDHMVVDYELGASAAMPARLTQVTLEGARTTLELDADGKPRLPEPLIRRLREVASDDSAPEEAKPAGGAEGLVRAAISSLLGFEVVFKGGQINLIDRHFARPEVGQAEVRGVDGRVFVDVLRRRLDASFAGRLVNGGGAFELRGMIRDDTRFVELRGRELGLKFLEPYLPERVHVGEGSRLDGRVSVTLEEQSAVLPVEFDGELKHLTVEDPRLALTPIQDIDLRAQGSVTVDPSSRALDIPRMRLLLGKAYMDVKARVEVPEGHKPVVQAALESKDLPIQDALDAFPADFAPKLQGAKVEGRMNLGVDVKIDLNNPAATVFDPSVTVDGFRVVTPPPEADVLSLTHSFSHKIFKNGVYVKTITVGPENPDFVPYDQLGRMLVGAVLTCEDGSFFRHNGFAMRHILDSIRTNIRQERFARGASTVTMQTAKNLFLSQEKTASRKFQEMLLTWWLEQALPKERILEIYMNIIEWGPHLYGIGPASQHYFGKRPTQLSALQAAYLGSIINNPVGYHRWYDRGYAGNGATLAFILRKMAERGTIPAEMVEWCDPYSPSFSKTGKPAPGGCEKPKEEEGEGAEGGTGEKKGGDAGAAAAAASGGSKPAAKKPAPKDEVLPEDFVPEPPPPPLDQVE